MPELPEVETLTLQLDRALRGKTISEVEIRNESILETGPEELKNKVQGKQIVQIARRGKYLQLNLSGGLTLWFHLGMTGQLLLEIPPSSLRPHTHFVLSFSNSRKRLFYRDVRRFGRITLTPTDEESFPRGVRRLGLEPKEWSPEDFIARFKTRRARIKNLLLNQTLVAGLGNIYADESLHRAGIHPLRRACRLERSRLERLREAMCEILGEAIRWGGSSIDDYFHLDGARGRFQDFHRVYGRAGEACSACGTRIRKIKLSGRTSSFCPHCQT